MWEEQGWSEEPEEEVQAGEPMCCLREEVKEEGGMRTLEQEVSEEEAAAPSEGVSCAFVAKGACHLCASAMRVAY